MKITIKQQANTKQNKTSTKQTNKNETKNIK